MALSLHPWLAAFALATALVGCAPAEPSPVSDDLLALTLHFQPPTAYRVVRGDTLAVIAAGQGVALDDLRAWNGLTGDRIEIGQRLLYWAGEPVVTVAAAPAPAPRTRRAAPRAARPKSAPILVMAPAEVVTLPPRPPPPAMVARSGVLGALDGDAATAGLIADGGLDEGLTDKLASLQPRGNLVAASYSQRGTSDFHNKADLDAPTYPDLVGAGQERPSSAARATSTVSARIQAPALAMPRAKACLAGPSDVSGDAGYAASQGLSLDQIRRATGAFVRNTLSCVPGDLGAGSVTTEITVGCDGRVTEVVVVDSDGLSSASVDCVAKTLRYAAFPAHDMPDGYTFGFPIRFAE